MFVECTNGDVLVMPSPAELLLEAEDEPNYLDARVYIPVMRTLRRKGFSYREIAGWLGKRGVPIDHNAVYRIYSASLSGTQLQYEEEQAEREAKE